MSIVAVLAERRRPKQPPESFDTRILDGMIVTKEWYDAEMKRRARAERERRNKVWVNEALSAEDYADRIAKYQQDFPSKDPWSAFEAGFNRVAADRPGEDVRIEEEKKRAAKTEETRAWLKERLERETRAPTQEYYAGIRFD